MKKGLIEPCFFCFSLLKSLKLLKYVLFISLNCVLVER